MSFDFLRKNGFTTVFLDIDNTVKPYGALNPDEGIKRHLNGLSEKGIKIVLCSNNFKRNAEPFAKKLGFECVSMCLKPSPFGYIRAKIKVHESRKKILVCGDRIFTDILGANLMLLKSALVEPIDVSSEGTAVKLERKIFSFAHKKSVDKRRGYNDAD